MSARRVASVAGLVAGMYLAVVFSIRRVSDWVLQAIGGPGGVARDGGLVLRYRPSESYDLAKLERRAERRGATIRREASDLILEVPGVKQEEASQIAAMSTRGGIEFREVLEDESMFKFRLENRDHKGTDLVAPGVHVSTDFWRLEDRPPRSTAYLIAAQPAQLTDAFAQLRARGWRQPPHSIIAFGREPCQTTRPSACDGGRTCSATRCCSMVTPWRAPPLRWTPTPVARSCSSSSTAMAPSALPRSPRGSSATSRRSWPAVRCERRRSSTA